MKLLSGFSRLLSFPELVEFEGGTKGGGSGLAGKMITHLPAPAPSHIVCARNAAACTVKQSLVFVGTEEGKILAIRQMFQQVQPQPLSPFFLLIF